MPGANMLHKAKGGRWLLEVFCGFHSPPKLSIDFKKEKL